jgi:hypothetical protein
MGEMCEDVLTKLLQGMAFRTMQAELMNYPSVTTKMMSACLTWPSRKTKQQGQGKGQPLNGWHPYPHRSVLDITIQNSGNRQTSRSCKDKGDVADESETAKKGKRIGIRAEGSLLFSCLETQYHVLSILGNNI